MYYEDALIGINEDHLVIKNCYLPWGNKVIPFDTISVIQVKEPGIMNGSWRLWGTGALQTWFAMDWSRPSRDAIFIVNFKEGGMNLGFTAESSADIIRILSDIRIPIEYG